MCIRDRKETSLPPLEQGQVLKLKELKSEQKFTQPPARYTEATLITVSYTHLDVYKRQMWP